MSEENNNPLKNVQSQDWNEERLKQLKEIMPDIFTNDGKLNINELKKVIDPESVSETERFEFRWLGKSQAKRDAFTPTDATLVYDEERSFRPEESEHLIIEGENLNVLKLLSKGYREQIKCIYIDPPYNTGKDFVYSDNFNQDRKEYWEDAQMTENGLKVDTNTETDGRFHSNWLDMMYSRLLIARQLLRKDGVIFISIDDNEVFHLRQLCNEVFGENNFIGQIVWQTATDNNPRQISIEHEYVLCYAKNKDEQDYWEIPSEKGQIIQEKYEDLKNEYEEDTDTIQSELRKWIRKQTNGDDLSGVSHYSYVDKQGVYYPGNSANTKPGGYTYDILHPSTKKVCAKPEYGYRFSLDTFKDAAKRGDVQWGENEKTIPKIKKRLDTVTQKLKSYYYEDNRATSANLKKLFDNKKVFNNPKSVNFLKHILSFVTEENDIVLDFFAGSGSTGQAIYELSSEGLEKLKFILVQLPEATDEDSEAYKAGYKKISDITIERNKRVIEKIIEEKKTEQPNLFTDDKAKDGQLDGLGFKVFKLTKSYFPRVEYAPDPEKTLEENVEALKKYIRDKEAQLVTVFNKDELITEILIKNGYKLNYTIAKQDKFKKNEIFHVSDSEKEMLVCLDGILEDETFEYFKKHTDQKLLVLERALDTTKKWNLKYYMGDNFKAF